MENQLLIPRKYLSFLIGILVFLGLYLTSLHHYLLFHSLAEIFSIAVARLSCAFCQPFLPGPLRRVPRPALF
jgi:hypothetical protein